MNTLVVLLVITGISLSLQLVVYLKLRQHEQKGDGSLAQRLEAFQLFLGQLDASIKDEVARNRQEWGLAAREQRTETGTAIKSFGEFSSKQIAHFATAQNERLVGMEQNLSKFSERLRADQEAVRTAQVAADRDLRADLQATSKLLQEGLDLNFKQQGQSAQTLRQEVLKILTDLGDSNRQNLGQMSQSMEKLSEKTEQRLELVRTTVDGNLKSLQEDNHKQLEHMRVVVDEKLQGTLEKRLSESFQQVSTHLEQVHKGLGEMQSLAAGVGDLKRVLTNVKVRGTWAEVQLGNLLEQALAPEQFAANVSTSQTGERVEYAIKLPGRDLDDQETIWLPIDAKFPMEDYRRLVEAQEQADPTAVEAAGKQLEARIRSCAKDISSKYLNPPQTTNFGIMYLPTEGLFAEVVRRPALIEALQQEQRVVIAGPTTLWSILTSLQMGFRTLALQKRSSEVWNILGAVKTEWSKYGAMLGKVKQKLDQASNTIGKLEVRNRAVERTLRSVDQLIPEEAAVHLPEVAEEIVAGIE